MKLDTILNIAQSYSLAKINILNKDLLKIQCKQNDQLVKLNKQLSQSNSISNEILKNQIKELKRQEKLRYYKNLTFNLGQTLKTIEDKENTNFKIFLSQLFLPLIESFSKDAVNELEEIGDKEYAQNILEKCKSITNSGKVYETQYYSSPWSRIIPAKTSITNYNAEKKIKNIEVSILLTKHQLDNIEIENKKNTNKSKGCLISSILFLIVWITLIIAIFLTDDFMTIPAALLLIFIAAIPLVIVIRGKTKKNEPCINENQQKKIELSAKLRDLNNELESTRSKEVELLRNYSSIVQEVTIDYPRWEKETQNIFDLLPIKQ